MKFGIIFLIAFLAFSALVPISASSQPIDGCDVTFAKRMDDTSVAELIFDLETYKETAQSSSDYDALLIDLCLNSPGGSISAAKTLVEYLEKETDGPWSSPHGISTRVENGMTCASACALVFMAGYDCWKNSCRVSRTIEPFATLAFHSPNIAQADSTATNPMVSRIVYQSAMSDLGYFFQLNSNPLFLGSRTRLPSTLIGEMLSHHDQDLFIIDKLFEAHTFDIQLAGHWKEPIIKSDEDMKLAMQALCDQYYWRNQARKTYPEAGYHYPESRTETWFGDEQPLAIMSDFQKNKIVYYNRLLGSGNTAWAVCAFYSGIDAGYPFISVRAEGTGTEIEDADYANLKLNNLNHEKDASISEAWSLVAPGINSYNAHMFWPMYERLSEIGLVKP